MGFSGGADSTALLLGLTKMAGTQGGCELLALHFNHDIHPEADRWQEHCERTCRELDVPLVCGKWNHGTSPEMREGAAREARYRWFRRTLPSDRPLLLAHHRDDQVETFLLNLLEGRGFHRMAGMLPKRSLEFGDLREVIRPLLDIPGETLRTYVHSGGLRWVDDPSNRNTAHRRVWIRTVILPELRRHYPGLDEAVVGTTRKLQRMVRIRANRARRLLAEVADPVAMRIFCLHAPLRVGALLSLDAVDREDVLREWIHAGSLPAPGRSGMTTLLRDLDRWNRTGTGSCGRYCLRLDWRGASIREYRGRLYLIGSLPDPGEAIPWDGEGMELVPGLAVHFETAGDVGTELPFPSELFWRWRRGGERVRLHGRSHGTSLKKACQSLGIPEWERDLLPHLACTHGIVWIHGIGWCEPATTQPGKLPGWTTGPGSVDDCHLRLTWRPRVAPEGSSSGAFDP